VGHSVDLELDRCARCNGVWFDKAEWSILQAHGLHDNLREIFNAGWQSAVRAEERERRAEQRLSERLGADAERVRSFAEWIENHSRASEILAYVQSRVR
jgi:Zn-finger nucleic acid-binding protein